MDTNNVTDSLLRVLQQIPDLENPVSAGFVEILLSGNVTTLDASSEGSLAGPFGPNYTDVPRLVRHQTFAIDYTPESIRKLLIGESLPRMDGMGSSKLPKFVPDSNQYQQGDHGRSEIVETLLNIPEPLRPGTGGVFSLESTILNSQWVVHPVFENVPDALRTTMVNVNVVPHLEPVDLHHDETQVQSHLLCGRKLWFVWSPTKKNLQVLAKAYRWSATQPNSGGVPMRLFNFNKELEGEVVILQNAGETAWIPPFCTHATFSLETSVLAGYEIITADKFPLTLGKVSLYRAYSQMLSEAERAGSLNYSRSILNSLERILKGDFGDVLRTYRLQPSTMSEIVAVWDTAKADRQALVDGNHELNGKVLKMWSTFLKTTAGNQCLICGAEVQGRRPLFDEHFLAEHWGPLAVKRKNSEVGGPSKRRKSTLS